MDGSRLSSVPFTTEDRQWDARFNVQLDSDLEQLLESIKRDWESGRIKYILVGGVEIGTKPYQDDYQIKHVHVAVMFANRISKRALLTPWQSWLWNLSLSNRFIHSLVHHQCISNIQLHNNVRTLNNCNCCSCCNFLFCYSL